jgi:uncharacterized membrane-anchored protein YitT (DUF2179 family)
MLNKFRIFLFPAVFMTALFPQALVFTYPSSSISPKEIVKTLLELINDLMAVLAGIAVLLFLWGIVRFIASAGNEQKRKEAKNLIIYGLVGLFVMTTFLGIIAIVQATFFDGGSLISTWYKYFLTP